MTLYYKPLNYSDVDKLTNLLNQRPYVFNGHYDPKWHENIIKLPSKWLTDSLYFIPGIWNDDELIAAIILKESASSPSWAWGHWVTKQGSTSLMYTSEGVEIFREADRQIFDEMEINRNLNRFYLSYKLADEPSNNLKNAGMSDRMFTWMNRMNYRVSKYKFYTDSIINAGEVPKYQYQKELLGNKTWPFRTAIRIGFLIE